jgi:hypothetical protein
MPKMRTQLGKPGLSTILTLGIANLNCGYYTTKSLLHYWAEKLTGSDQRVPIPGFHKLRSLAFDPSAGDGGEALQNAVDELSTAPVNFDVWKQRLESFGPLLAGGMLGRADWGRDSAGNPRGIGHNVLIVGVEGRPGHEPDRLAFKDPLSWRDEVQWDDYSNMKDRIDSLHAIRRQRASMLLPQLNPRIVVP